MVPYKALKLEPFPQKMHGRMDNLFYPSLDKYKKVFFFFFFWMKTISCS